MAFPEEMKQNIHSYIHRHQGQDEFYESYFWFISDEGLRRRVSEEFKSVRYIYKFLEGMQAEGWLKIAQIRVQILLYASIYEAVLHHVLLQHYPDTVEVRLLTETKVRTRINISGEITNKIKQKYNPDGEVIVYQVKSGIMDERKIVFEDKANAAFAIGIINEEVKNVIVRVYSLRNAIHIHAEIRRNVEYEIESAKEAYWHLQGFCNSISKKLVNDNKISVQNVEEVS